MYYCTFPLSRFLLRSFYLHLHFLSLHCFLKHRKIFRSHIYIQFCYSQSFLGMFNCIQFKVEKKTIFLKRKNLHQNKKKNTMTIIILSRIIERKTKWTFPLYSLLFSFCAKEIHLKKMREDERREKNVPVFLIFFLSMRHTHQVKIWNG